MAVANSMHGLQGTDRDHDKHPLRLQLNAAIVPMTTVSTATTTTTSPVVAHAEWELPSKSSHRRPPLLSWCDILVILTTLIIASAILVTIVLVANTDRQAHPSVPNATSVIHSVAPVRNNTNPEISSQAYLQRLRQVLQITPTGNAVQNSAVEWLVYNDSQVLNLHNSLDRLKQRYALVVFYLATGSWDLLGGFATPSGAHEHECLWPGIYCNGRDVVYAVEITPDIGKPQGSLPSEIALLTQLERLELNDNALTGALPSSLYSLTALYTLRLSNTSVSSTLSPLLANLTSLAWLDLSYSGVGGLIPTDLKVATQLRRLHLTHTHISGSLPASLGNLIRLGELHLDDTNLIGSVPETICQLRLKNLYDLRVDCSEKLECKCCTSCS